MEGFRFLSEEKLRVQAGIQLDDPFFQTSKGDIIARLTELKEIESVEVTKHFPGRIHIFIHEYPHVAYELNDGQLEAVLANGINVPAPKTIPDQPLLSGWEANEGLKETLTEVLATIPKESLSDVSEIQPAPSNSYEDRIVFYSRSSFEVITTIKKLPDKLSYFDEIVADLQKKGTMTGRIVMLEADNHEPFELENKSSEDSLE